jgi:xanthine dehydrogenase YagS FAD-binding subunit
MHPFTYLRSETEQHALQLAKTTADSQFIAGGTTLLDLMKYHIETPTQLVDINPLPLKTIQVKDGSLHIGALARMSDVALHPDVTKNFPVLSESLLLAASPQLRNMATMGGNILQRTRCPYFRDTAFACNKRQPGSGCSALGGHNRTHAILGASDACIATHPSDFAVALAALDGTLHLKAAGGDRTIPATDFHRLPGTTPHLETALQHGELITAINIPITAWAKRSRYLKLRDRASYAFALVSVAAGLDIEAGIIREARIALGGVGTKPWRSLKSEQLLIGAKPDAAAFRAAADAALEGAKTFTHNGFKVPMAKNAIIYTLTTLAAS